MKLDKNLILLNQTFNTKEEAIRKAGELLVHGEIVEQNYIDSMLEREKIVTTYMGNFVAIPHGTDEAKESIRQTGISIIQVPHGVDFSEDDNEEKLAMIIFGIAGAGDDHLELLSKIAVFCSDVQNVVQMTNADSVDEIVNMLEGVKI